MCERPLPSSSVSDDEDHVSHVGDAAKTSNGCQSKEEGGLRKRNESAEEKLKRRKVERKRRRLSRQKVSGILIPTPNAPRKVITQFNQVWDRESVFVTRVMQCLPEVYNPGLFIEEEERVEGYLNQEDNAQDKLNENEKVQKFFAKVKRKLESQGVEQTERATSYQELKERLDRKIAELAQKPNQKKREKKLQKKLRAKEGKEKSNKGKKLISQSASSVGAKSYEDSTLLQPDTNSAKTPLKQKPVVKSNGEIVYSKFDFISTESRKNSNTQPSVVPAVSSKSKNDRKSVSKPTSEELLRKAEKHEQNISRLATQGKKAEAVSLAETQKWDTAMKRAEGQKVRDDPHLLKKTIKKLEKQKQVTKKKWKQRVDMVEKQKELRQQKRQTNIQSRKDENKKRGKKLLRKRGRIV